VTPKGAGAGGARSIHPALRARALVRRPSFELGSGGPTYKQARGLPFACGSLLLVAGGRRCCLLWDSPRLATCIL